MLYVALHAGSDLEFSAFGDDVLLKVFVAACRLSKWQIAYGSYLSVLILLFRGQFVVIVVGSG